MAKKRANREGSIYRDGDYWCAAITLRDGSRKKKRSKYQYVVREWLQEQKTALKSGYHLQDNNVRFSVFLDHFVKDIAGPTVKPKTLDSYRWLIESHIRPHSNIKDRSARYSRFDDAETRRWFKQAISPAYACGYPESPQ